MARVSVDVTGMQVLPLPQETFLLHACNDLAPTETIELHTHKDSGRPRFSTIRFPLMRSTLSSRRTMSSLSSDDVRRIAKLARLELTDAEIEKFAPQLTSILGYIDMLGEVDTKNIVAAAQPTGLTDAFREDVITSGEVSPDALLATSPLPITEHQIQTPSAHE